MIFISYSSADHEDYFVDFEKFLKPFAEELDVWTDRRGLQAGDAWEREIEEAIRDAHWAVLMVSKNFYSSSFISQKELPKLLAAHLEGRLRVLPLYLTFCNADTVPCRPEGREETVILGRIQGLNQLDHPIADFAGNARDREFAAAVTKLRELIRPAPVRRKQSPSTRRMADRKELTVDLHVGGGHLLRTAYSPESREVMSREDWTPIEGELDYWTRREPESLNDPARGVFLCRLLLGPAENQQRVLEGVFGGPKPHHPSRHPVRVRIRADHAPLAKQPWSRVCYANRVLREDGWTFELVAEGVERPVDELHSLPEAFLKAPCPVMLVIPEPQNERVWSARSHRRDLVHCFGEAWPSTYFSETDDWESIEAELLRRQIGVFYFCGRLSETDGHLFLDLESPQPGAGIPLKRLAEIWKRRPPLLAFLNLIAENPKPVGGAIAELSSARVLLAQTSSDRSEAAGAAVQWLRGFLQGGSESDPVIEAHRHLLPTTTVYSSYGRWRTRITQSAPAGVMAQFILDRIAQKAKVLHALSEMGRDHHRRLCCLIGTGSAPNRPDLLGLQLHLHLRTQSLQNAALLPREEIILPLEKGFTTDQVEQSFREHFCLDGRQKLKVATGFGKPVLGMPVVFLDWGTRGGQHGCIDVPDDLKAWAEFCCRRLLPDCGDEFRIFSLISLEVDEEKQKGVDRLIEDMISLPQFEDLAFTVAQLPTLGKVHRQDLVTCLTSDEYNCPDANLRLELPAILYKAFEGDFSLTHEWLDKAQGQGWYEMFDQLKARVESNGDSPEPSDLGSITL